MFILHLAYGLAHNYLNLDGSVQFQTSTPMERLQALAVAGRNGGMATRHANYIPIAISLKLYAFPKMICTAHGDMV